ncbi:MAG: MBL fold metallo-hydrolase [Myxococcales bacterium]|jgi:ribonuclease BN (tRNA processing enzyme)|nr:MBL fold metallo-hydrolase [Myxococcales bacterium]
MEFVALGIGDAFSQHYYSSCLMIHHQGAQLLLDCPHPIRKIMYEAGQTSGIAMDVDTIDAVLLTHLHADHASGIEGLGFYGRHVIQRQLTLAAHPDVLGGLWSGQLEHVMAPLCDPPADRRRFSDYFNAIELSDTAETAIGPFAVQCRKTRHHVPTTAFRIRAGGRTLGYSADTAFDPELIDWLSAADLIIHESNYGSHTPYESLLALPQALRDKMRLIHLPDDFDRDASRIEPLRQGRRYII